MFSECKWDNMNYTRLLLGLLLGEYFLEYVFKKFQKKIKKIYKIYNIIMSRFM
jgi:hypothetical protein